MQAMKGDNYISLDLEAGTADIYFNRAAILNGLAEILPALHGRLLDLGCGRMPYRQYILDNSRVEVYHGVDIHGAAVYDSGVKPDFHWDGRVLPFGDCSYDCVISTEVLEHCYDPCRYLAEACRVLVPGGLIFITTPFLWNLHEVPNDHYRYTPYSMRRLLEDAGFRDIHVEAPGGWNASLAQMMGLWLKRAPIAGWERAVLAPFCLAAMRFLMRRDRPISNFQGSAMITGLIVKAYK